MVEPLNQLSTFQFRSLEKIILARGGSGGEEVTNG
jgi:hypothetical protein